MTTTDDAREFRERLTRLEVLLGEVDRIEDYAAQSLTREVVQALLELHGRGLERVLQHLADDREVGARLLETVSADEVAGGLLLLHGLHPLDLETRVLQALEQVRPALKQHGGNVELIGVEEGVVRLRLLGSCHGCPSSSVTMKQTIEEAILVKAPDAISLEVEGAVDAPSMTPDGQQLVVLTLS